MTTARPSMIPRLEKLKAGLGTAGIVAVGLEALSSGVLASILKGVLGDAIQIIVVILAGFAAGYVTDVPQRKANHQAGPEDEGGMTDAFRH